MLGLESFRFSSAWKGLPKSLARACSRATLHGSLPKSLARACSRATLHGSLIAGLATMTVMGCSGGGCTSGCGGASVIPKGFPKAGRVTNAAAVRLTRPGLDFLEQNLPPILQKNADFGGGVP